MVPFLNHAVPLTPIENPRIAAIPYTLAPVCRLLRSEFRKAVTSTLSMVTFGSGI